MLIHIGGTHSSISHSCLYNFVSFFYLKFLLRQVRCCCKCLKISDLHQTQLWAQGYELLVVGSPTFQHNPKSIQKYIDDTVCFIFMLGHISQPYLQLNILHTSFCFGDLVKSLPICHPVWSSAEEPVILLTPPPCFDRFSRSWPAPVIHM